MKRNVLFISVHPDDETLGCGGTILKHKANGDTINWLNITDMDNNHPFGFSPEIVEKVQKIIGKVVNSYEFNNFINLKFYERIIDTISLSELISKISEAK